MVETGRTRCSNPPIKQLPKHHDPVGIRRAFVPRPGFVYANDDYSTLELRALAQVCLWLFGQSKMADALHEGLDLHYMLAAWQLGVPYDEVKNHPEAKTRRQLSKAANFGFPGGLGAASFITYARKAFGVTITVPEARDLKRQWLAAWPEARLYFDYIGDRCARSGDSFTALQFKSGRLRGGVGYCDGCNTFFQGLAADGAKAAMFYASQECYTGTSEIWTGSEPSPLHGSRIVSFMHDVLLVECPEDRAPEAAARLSEVMIAGMECYIPDVPITTGGATLTRRWLTDAEPVFDAGGRLTIFEDDTDART